MDFLSDEAVFLKKTIILTKVHEKKIVIFKTIYRKNGRSFRRFLDEVSIRIVKNRQKLLPLFWQQKNPDRDCDRDFWRRHPDLNWGIKVLQTSALPLGYVAILERVTRLELATSTLARWRSTR